MPTKSRRPKPPLPKRRPKTPTPSRPTWVPVDEAGFMRQFEVSLLRPVDDDAPPVDVDDLPEGPPSLALTNKERAFLAERIAVRERETAALRLAHRRGKAPGHTPWHTVVRDLIAKNPTATDAEIAKHCVALAEGDDDVFESYVVGRDRTECRNVVGRECPRVDAHFHVHDSHERLRPLRIERLLKVIRTVIRTARRGAPAAR